MAKSTSPEQTDRPGELRLWLLPIGIALLLLACFVLSSINTGPGFLVDGQVRHIWLESKVTNYPFCPPEIPCPISVVLQQNHFVLWLVWNTKSQVGVETGFRKLIDIPLPR